MFKYLYKGPDSVLVGFRKENNLNIDTEIAINNSNNISNVLNYDEIEHLATRYVCPPKAMYRLLEVKLYDQLHVVYPLAVHSENEQFVYFKKGTETELIDRNAYNHCTKKISLPVDVV